MTKAAAATTPARQAAARLRHTLLFGAPLLVLALGHMLSNLVRTLPAIAADVIAAGLAVPQASLAGLTSAYHFAFAAGQIPLGAALDRYGVRPVSLTLFAIVTAGAVLAATLSSAAGFLLAQVLLGLGCCGMLLCPMTLAAKLLTPAQFGLWSGLILGVGNAGMLLSGSPMAWLVERLGWRAGFWIAAVSALLVGALVLIFVPNTPPSRNGSLTTLRAEAREVLRIGLQFRLRGVVTLAFASYAAVIAVRGLWGGPWLMEVKGLSRLAAGHALMPLTFALVLGPIMSGMLDRRLGRRRGLVATGHVLAGFTLLLVAAGGPGGILARAAGVSDFPAGFDRLALFVFGGAISVQPLLFAMGRSAVSPDQVGKALAAINLSFFTGAAVLQAVTGLVAESWGISAVLAFLGTVLIAATVPFLAFTATCKRRTPEPGTGAS
jgi:predicted MFS family arabinose efflux permease